MAAKKKKSTSRASRRDEATNTLDNVTSNLSAIAENIQEFIDEYDQEGETKKELTKEILETAVDGWEGEVLAEDGNATSAISVLEDLKDEIESWRDAIEEKFSGTDKYAALEECADNLQSAVDEADVDWEVFSKVDFKEGAKAALEALSEAKTDLEAIADTLTSAKDTAESAEFPGMYS